MNRNTWFAAGLMASSFSAFSVSQYHAVLLQFNHHFSSTEIGQAFFWGSLTFFLAPLALQFLARRGWKASHTLSFCLLLEALSLFLMPRLSGFFPVSLSYILFAMSSQLAGSLVGSTCLLALSGPRQEQNFFMIRSLGTIAFASTCFANSFLAQHFALSQVYWIFVLGATLAAFFALYTYGPEHKNPSQQTHPHWQLSKAKDLWPLLALLSIANMAAYSGASYTGSLIRNNLGGSDADVALSWTISTAAEVPLIWIAAWMTSRLSLRWIFSLGMLSTSLKLGISALAPNLATIFAAQVFHGFFFGASLAAVGVLLRRMMAAELVPQALLSCSLIYSGLANAFSGLLSGYLWDYFGLRFTFGLWALLALIAALITLKKPLKHEHP